MVKSLLDTDILSEYLKGHDQTVIGHAARYAQQFGIFVFTSVTVYEIVYGLELKSAELPGCLIAAIAVRLEIPLVTGNTEDFKAIQKTGIDLSIQNWREP